MFGVKETLSKTLNERIINKQFITNIYITNEVTTVKWLVLVRLEHAMIIRIMYSSGIKITI